jgi:hypothetical protein
LNDLFDLIVALAIQVQNLVSGFDKNGFQIKMVGPRPNQHFNDNKWFFLVFLVAGEEKNKKMMMKIKCIYV